MIYILYTYGFILTNSKQLTIFLMEFVLRMNSFLLFWKCSVEVLWPALMFLSYESNKSCRASRRSVQVSINLLDVWVIIVFVMCLIVSSICCSRNMRDFASLNWIGFISLIVSYRKIKKFECLITRWNFNFIKNEYYLKKILSLNIGR